MPAKWDSVMLVIWLGALLVIAGILLLVAKAIWTGPMSTADRPRMGETPQTLEPPGPAIMVFTLSGNWPGLALMMLGALLLLLGGAFI